MQECLIIHSVPPPFYVVYFHDPVEVGQSRGGGCEATAAAPPANFLNDDDERSGWSTWAALPEAPIVS